MTPQSINNRIAFQIPDADLQAVQAALQTLQARLVPLLVNLAAAPGARRSSLRAWCPVSRPSCGR